MDRDGYEILDGYREDFDRDLDSILMDMRAYEEFEPFGTDTDQNGRELVAGPARAVERLRLPERAVYELLVAAGHTRHRRVEQERIPLSRAMSEVEELLRTLTTANRSIFHRGRVHVMAIGDNDSTAENSGEMVGRPVNDKQRAVLAWLASGATQDPPEAAMKHSAAALKSRGLVRVRRLQGKWTAELTDAGHDYLEDGGYPPDPEPSPRTAANASGTAARSGAPAGRGKTGRRTPALAATPAPPVLPGDVAGMRITKPHPAVRSLMERPVALGADHDTRRRGFIAAHMLVRAADDAGFTIEGHLQPRTRSGVTPYRGERLVTSTLGISGWS
jgi:hypothetical protein